MVSSCHRKVMNSWYQLADTEKHIKATRTNVTLKFLSVVSQRYTTHTTLGRLSSVQSMTGHTGLNSPSRIITGITKIQIGVHLACFHLHLCSNCFCEGHKGVKSNLAELLTSVRVSTPCCKN